jgi:hypothetical protein
MYSLCSICLVHVCSISRTTEQISLGVNAKRCQASSILTCVNPVTPTLHKSQNQFVFLKSGFSYENLIYNIKQKFQYGLQLLFETSDINIQHEQLKSFWFCSIVSVGWVALHEYIICIKWNMVSIMCADYQWMPLENVCTPREYKLHHLLLFQPNRSH